MLDNWQRIEQIIKWAGAASVSAFAREIGLNRGENLYQIKRGNNGISKELAEIITGKYPSVSKAWLLTGEGDMLPGAGIKEKYDIPFYKTDAEELVAGNPDDSLPSTGNDRDPDLTHAPSYYVSFPMLRGCDFAAFTFSDAMHPEIPRGSTVFFQRMQPSNLTPGGIYLVVTAFFSGIRHVRKDPGSTLVRLVPRNKDDFDEVMVETADILKLYQVKGILVHK